MSTPQSSTPAAEAAGAPLPPNQYHLLGDGIRIAYYPDGGAGPIKINGPTVLEYEDDEQLREFGPDEVRVVASADLGTYVSATLTTARDVGSTTATLLLPKVMLGPEESTAVNTKLITTCHNSGVGAPDARQRDHYTVTALTGEASIGPLPRAESTSQASPPARRLPL